jgi:hypothetical protein
MNIYHPIRNENIKRNLKRNPKNMCTFIYCLVFLQNTKEELKTKKLSRARKGRRKKRKNKQGEQTK